MTKPSKNNDTFQDLMLLDKMEAIKKYGAPCFYEHLVLENKQIGFRIGLNKFYSQEELSTKSIMIEELTWEKDIQKWVTVWYQIMDNKTEAKDFCVWKKGTDFYHFDL